MSTPRLRSFDDRRSFDNRKHERTLFVSIYRWQAANGVYAKLVRVRPKPETQAPSFQHENPSRESEPMQVGKIGKATYARPAGFPKGKLSNSNEWNNNMRHPRK